jgi:hypothetical protein
MYAYYFSAKYFHEYEFNPFALSFHSYYFYNFLFLSSQFYSIHFLQLLHYITFISLLFLFYFVLLLAQKYKTITEPDPFPPNLLPLSGTTRNHTHFRADRKIFPNEICKKTQRTNRNHVEIHKRLNKQMYKISAPFTAILPIVKTSSHVAEFLLCPLKAQHTTC